MEVVSPNKSILWVGPKWENANNKPPDPFEIWPVIYVENLGDTRKILEKNPVISIFLDLDFCKALEPNIYSWLNQNSGTSRITVLGSNLSKGHCIDLVNAGVRRIIDKKKSAKISEEIRLELNELANILSSRELASLQRMEEQQLFLSDKMNSLSMLVNGIAHEINNPVNFVLLNSGIFQNIWDDVEKILEEYEEENGDFALGGLSFGESKEKLRSLISGMSEGGKRIKEIVESLKNYAGQEPDVLFDVVDINKLVDSAILMVGNLANKKTQGIQIIKDLNIPKINGSSQQLEQILINLLTNACDAIEEKNGGILIETKLVSSKKCIQIQVSDEGIGIPPENLPKITEPFFTTKRAKGCAGLGLYTAYKLVNKHKGSLTIKSKFGEGTVCNITLPLNAE